MTRTGRRNFRRGDISEPPQGREKREPERAALFCEAALVLPRTSA